MNRIYPLIGYPLIGAFTGGVVGISVGVLVVILSNYIEGVAPAGTVYGADQVVISSLCCLFPGILSGAAGAIVMLSLLQPVIDRQTTEYREWAMGTGMAIVGGGLTSLFLLGSLSLCLILVSIVCNRSGPGACG